MNKTVFAACVAVSAIAFPAAAQAQSAAAAQPFVGISAGYHDLGVDDSDATYAGFAINDASPIVGVIAGVDFPVASNLFAGVEANYHIGTDAIDSEYGASLRLGFRAEGGAKYYIRGGYQEVDFDLYKIIEPEQPAGTFDGIDDSDGDYLVGAGVEFPIGKAALRVNLDTIGFDSLRATTGVAFSF
ncbi:outer membrane beta-barrel protein [Qipengyuania zhejiangensis]|uniref:outer membrane beta-barrel protein n=1 Tax=Qipengyuania zhejiangensis TaxID=3077782 RepID=UPI002D784E08|nr:outer membrane beta-barrel protein [Qipengyuania sp. Z2]